MRSHLTKCRECSRIVKRSNRDGLCGECFAESREYRPTEPIWGEDGLAARIRNARTEYQQEIAARKTRPVFMVPRVRLLLETSHMED